MKHQIKKMKNQLKNLNSVVFIYFILVILILLSGCNRNVGYLTDNKLNYQNEKIKDFDSSYYVNLEFVYYPRFKDDLLLRLNVIDYSKKNDNKVNMQIVEFDKCSLYLSNFKDTLKFLKKEGKQCYYLLNSKKIPNKIISIIYFSITKSDSNFIVSKKYELKKYNNYNFGLH